MSTLYFSILFTFFNKPDIAGVRPFLNSNLMALQQVLIKLTNAVFPRWKLIAETYAIYQCAEARCMDGYTVAYVVSKALVRTIAILDR